MEKVTDELHGDWSDIHSNQKQKILTQICVNMAKLNEIVEWRNREEKARRENADLCEWMKIQQLEQLGKIIKGMKEREKRGGEHDPK